MNKNNLIVGIFASVFLFLIILLVIPSLIAKEVDVQGEYVGSETCMECHEEQYKNYKMSIHYLTEKKNLKIKGCEACHVEHSEQTKPSLLKTSSTKKLLYVS